MVQYVVRGCALLLLAALPAAVCLAQVPTPAFRISALSGDDVPGGIYNGSPVSITMTVRNASTFSGAFQAALEIPAGYTFVDPKPCGGTVRSPPACRGKAGTLSNYLLWPDGSDGMGTGNTLAAGATSTCTARLVANTVTARDSVLADVYPAPHSFCQSNFTDSQNYSFTTTTQPTTDVSIAISANKNTVPLGSTVDYTLTLRNLGRQDATNVQTTFGFPATLSVVPKLCSGSSPGNGQTIGWTVNTLAYGSSVTCVLTATAQSGAGTNATVTAQTGLPTSMTDTNTSNNLATNTVALVQAGSTSADLAVQLGGTTPGHTYVPGEALQVTVTATDLSNTVANDVVTTVHVRDNGRLTGLSASCGSFDASGTLKWSVPSIAGGHSVVCNLSATVAGGSRHVPITAKITASNLGTNVAQLMDALIVPVNPAPRRISVRMDGTPTVRDSSHVRLSHDGSTAVFQSQEPQLVASNSNALGQDIYRVGADGKPVLETIDSSGHQLTGGATLPAISGDGSVVAFSHVNSGFLAPTAAKDFSATGQMWAGSAGQPKHQVDTTPSGGAPNGPSIGAPSVSSGGGKKLVFCSSASNLVSGDTNSANDVFLVDPTNPAQAPQLISTDANGHQLPGDSCEPKISADGTKVVFTISSPTLYRVAARQVVRKDLTTGALDLITVNTTPAGPGGGADSSEPTINADGSVIAFTSAYDFDGQGAPVGGKEVFVSLPAVPGAAPVMRRVRSSDGTVPNGASQHAQLSDDGSVLVMQTLATNFFGSGKADSGTAACGTVAITMNFFAPASVGSSLCAGQSANQNPSISGDGTVVGIDSNAPQAGTTSNNSNAYLQGISGLNDVGKSDFDGDYSGQWDDPNQSGHGLVIDVAPPQSNGDHFMSVIWFVYANGQPTWVLGAGTPHAGTGVNTGRTVLQVDQVGIFQGLSFPIGEATVTPKVWGSMTIVFADAHTAVMTWSSTYPGFNSGTLALTHFLPVSVPANDAPGAQIKACYSGNWKEPTKSGHGFEFEVVPLTPPVLVTDWFAYSPTGAPVWLQGVGTITGNTAQVPLQLLDGSGAQFPPRFDSTQLTAHSWGTLSVTFSDATHAHATWNSTLPGYGQGAIDLVPSGGGLDHRSCQ